MRTLAMAAVVFGCLAVGFWFGDALVWGGRGWIAYALGVVWFTVLAMRWNGGEKPNRKRVGFTLVELLVVITIIGTLAALSLGALSSARTAGREAATQATIAKLNTIIMERYENYLTRRVPVSTAGMTPTQAARARLDAIRDLQRMEMPDALTDITNPPITFSWGSVPEPALHRLYMTNPPTANMDPAQCLYMIVSMASPEALEQFSADEIGSVDGRHIFIDGWGLPIMFLRWAPGYRSPIQSGDPVAQHDPFDTRKLGPSDFAMMPLIYSGRGKRDATGKPQYGINLVGGYTFSGDPYAESQLGAFIPNMGGEGCITNHGLEQR